MNTSTKATLSMLTLFFQIVAFCTSLFTLGFGNAVVIIPALALTLVLVLDAFLGFLKNASLKASVMMVSMFFIIAALCAAASFGIVYFVFTALAVALGIVYFVLYINSLIKK